MSILLLNLSESDDATNRKPKVNIESAYLSTINDGSICSVWSLFNSSGVLLHHFRKLSPPLRGHTHNIPEYLYKLRLYLCKGLLHLDGVLLTIPAYTCW